MPAEFSRGDEQFFLGVPLQAQVGRATRDPLALDECKGRREIKRIISHWDSGFDHLGITEGIVPVVEMVHLDPAAFLHHCCAFDRRRAGCFQKAVVVGNPTMLSLSSPFHAPQVRRLWRHANAAVLILVVDLIGILAQIAVEIREHPESMILGINRAGQQACPLRGLRIAQQRIDELIIGRLE